jgi:hypothetical protein
VRIEWRRTYALRMGPIIYFGRPYLEDHGAVFQQRSVKRRAWGVGFNAASLFRFVVDGFD